jgi:DNA modification methylase
LVDPDGGIIAGHGWVLAARKLALEQVPTIELGHLTDAQRRAYIIADNKLALNAEHPTMKPVALFEYQMLNNTKGGDAVLDSFGGSGTTLIAAEKNGRIARLMELDPRYCDVIVKRWQDYTGKQATLEATGQTFSEVATGRVLEAA